MSPWHPNLRNAHDRKLLKAIARASVEQPTRPAPPPRPRGPRPKESDRSSALDRLTARGWSCYAFDAASNTHTLRHRDGREICKESYNAMIDAALALEV